MKLLLDVMRVRNFGIILMGFKVEGVCYICEVINFVIEDEFFFVEKFIIIC